MANPKYGIQGTSGRECNASSISVDSKCSIAKLYFPKAELTFYQLIQAVIWFVAIEVSQPKKLKSPKGATVHSAGVVRYTLKRFFPFFQQHS